MMCLSPWLNPMWAKALEPAGITLGVKKGAAPLDIMGKS
jgi:hypothetical protein